MLRPEVNNDKLKYYSNNLNRRLLSEEKFHDSKFVLDACYPLHYKFNPTYRIFLRMKEKLGDIQGKRILEYGCGEGWVTAELASLGVVIDSFDVSKEAVKQTKEFLRKRNLDGNSTVRRLAAEELDYPDNTFDIVFGFAILHHLDLDKAVPELYRVMKPSGSAYFAEPLGANPVINVYRRLTPQYRTVDERPLIPREFSHYTKRFTNFSHEEFYLTALLPLALAYLPILRRFTIVLLDPFLKLDNILLRYLPGLGTFAWYSIITLRK